MYNDNYRNRFSTISAATYGKDFDLSDFHEDVIFTPTHNHKDFEIILIKKGTAKFHVGDYRFFAKDGDIVLINPYEIHSAYAIAENDCFSYYCITFDLAMLSATPLHPASVICKGLSDGYIKFEHLVKNRELINLLKKSEETFTAKNEGWEFFMSSIIFNIFGILYENNNYTKITTPTKSHIFVKNVLKYIEANFSDSITSADAAEHLNYNNSYFCRLFKKSFGQSFGEYLNFHRINHAKGLLKHGLNVSQVALSCGFNNLSYFAKVFKAHTGINPSEIKGSL